MAVIKELNFDLDKHLFLSQVAEEIGRYGVTEIKCPVCGGRFTLQHMGSSYVLRCETDNCLKLTSRGI